MKKNFIKIILCTCLLIIIICMMLFNPKTYTDEDFNIDTYKSSIDKDNDGIDDQTDILMGAKEYIDKNPKYKSKYYSTGYPNDEYGVCTDVVGFALLNAGYDLRNLVNENILSNQNDYNIDVVDINIDFRRVRNLDVYFKNTAISLTTDINDFEAWQSGDIVVFNNHIGIISDKRNSKGVPLVIHHAGVLQINYVEDILGKREIIGHYRIS